MASWLPVNPVSLLGYAASAFHTGGSVQAAPAVKLVPLPITTDADAKQRARLAMTSSPSYPESTDVPEATRETSRWDGYVLGRLHAVDGYVLVRRVAVCHVQ